MRRSSARHDGLNAATEGSICTSKGPDHNLDWHACAVETLREKDLLAAQAVECTCKLHLHTATKHVSIFNTKVILEENMQTCFCMNKTSIRVSAATCRPWSCLTADDLCGYMPRCISDCQAPMYLGQRERMTQMEHAIHVGVREVAKEFACIPRLPCKT